MNITRTGARTTRLGLIGAAIALAISASAPAWAQTYPAKPIDMSVSYSVGGGTDVVARLVAGEMAKVLGQPVVVQNRVGAGGTLAVAHVAKAAADGYSIGWFTGGPIVLAPIVEKSLPYDVRRDLIPVSQVQSTDQVLVVRPGLPASRIGELLELARKAPGTIVMAHTGVGTAQLLAAVMLERFGKVELNKVPYKGEAQMLADIAGERVDIGLVTATSAEVMRKAGKIRVLSSGGPVRSHMFPDVPSMAEAGFPDFDANSHMGLYAPAGTPAAVVARLATAAREVVANPQVSERLRGMGGTPVGSTPAEFAAFLRKDSDRAEQMLK